MQRVQDNRILFALTNEMHENTNIKRRKTKKQTQCIVFVALRVYYTCSRQHFDVYLFFALLCIAFAEGDVYFSTMHRHTCLSAPHAISSDGTLQIDNMRTEKFIKKYKWRQQEKASDKRENGN